MKTGLLILPLFCICCFCLGQNKLEENIAQFEKPENVKLINSYVFGGKSLNDPSIKKLQLRARQLWEQSQKESFIEGVFYGASYSFLFSTKPLKEDSCNYYLSIQYEAARLLDKAKIWARYYKNKSYYCDKINDFRCSLENQQKTSEYYQQLGESENLVKTYMNIAAIYSKLADTANNRKYKTFAYKNIDDKVSQGTKNRLLINIAMGLITNSPDSSLTIVDQILTKKTDSTTRGICTYIQSESFLIKEEYQKCIEKSTFFLKYFEPWVYPSLVMNAHYNKSEAYFHQKHFEKALFHGNIALEKANDKNASFIFKSLHKYLAKLNDSLGHTTTSNYHLNQYISVNDSLFTIEKAKAIEELETKFQTVQKELDIANLTQENNEKNKWIQGIGALAVGIILVTAVAVTTYRNRTLQKEKEAVMLEQQLFRSQMNPHFTFNVLGSLQSYIMEDGSSEKAAYYLSKFSKLLRKILNQSNTEFISIREEMETLSHYIALQKLRYDDFSYEFIVANQLNKDQILIPPMIIQPLIENAIEHGKVYKKKEGFVKVAISQSNDVLIIAVEDNGIGIKSQSFKNHKSMALSIIQKRLGQTNGPIISQNAFQGVSVQVKITPTHYENSYS